MAKMEVKTSLLDNMIGVGDMVLLEPLNEDTVIDNPFFSMEVDLAKVAKAGYSDVVITCVTNGDDFASVEPTAETIMAPGVGLLVVNK